MFRNSVATESSGEWASAQDTLRSTDSNPAPANRNDSSLSGQVDKADTTIPTVISPTGTPPFPSPAIPSKLVQPASLIGGPSTDPTYDTHVRTDRLPENKAQSPSDEVDGSQLPQLSPLVPVRPLSESQPNIQAQSTMISPHVSQNTSTHSIPASSVVPQEPPSQYPQDVPTAQTSSFRADGDIPASFSGSPREPPQNLNSNPPQIFPPPIPQRSVTPFRQSANTPSVHYGTSQPNRPQSAIASQLYSPRPIVPQSAPPQFYSLPNAPTPEAQSIRVGSPLRLFPFPAPSRFHSYSLPSARTPQTHSSHAGTPQQFVPQSVHQSYSTAGTSTSRAHSTHMGLPPGFVPQQSIQHSAPPHSYGLPSAPTPQTHSSHAGTPQQFVPQSGPQLYGIPNISTPQAQSTHPQSTLPYVYTPTPQAQSIHMGTPQSFIPQPHSNPITQTINPQTRRRVESFVAHDPFQASRGSKKAHGPSDVLTFDQIPTPGSTPEPTFSLGAAKSPYGYLPTFGGISSPYSAVYPYSHSSTQPGIHPPSNVPAPQIPPSRASWSPELEVQMLNIPRRRYDTYETDDNHLVIPPATPSSSPVSEQPVQPHIPALPESHVPSTQDSPIPAVPIHQPSFPSLPEDISSNSHESQIGTDESSPWPYVPPNPQHFAATYPPTNPNTNSEHEFTEDAIEFVSVTLPKQMYLYFLLRLPSLYFSRVSRIFEEADMALPYIKEMALQMASQGLIHEFEMQMAFESSTVPTPYKRLASTWEFFIDSVMREWKTFNIISVLLLTAILTILQIQGAAEDPLTRYTALFSLMCALISLLFGCMYIIRFSSMRKPYKAAEWALEALKTKTLIWWNVWVLLAMPAIWLTWSILLYIACIMAFVWRSAVTDTTTREISDTGLLVVRIVITVVLVIGMIYAFLIMTTFRRYGSAMDRKWKQRIDDWIKKKVRKQRSFVHPTPFPQLSPFPRPSPSRQPAFPQPTLGNPQPSTPHAYPAGSTTYQVPTDNFSPYHPPSFGDAQSRYAWDTYGPAYSSDTYVPPLQPRWTFTGSPNSPSYSDVPDDHLWDAYTPAPALDSHLPPTEAHLTPPAWLPDDVTRANTTFNAGYIPNQTPTPPPLPPKASPGETPPEFVPYKNPALKATRKKVYLAVPPPPSLPPIPGTPIDRSSKDSVISPSELKNRVGGDDDVPDNKNRVPLISGQGGVNLANKDRDKKVPGGDDDKNRVRFRFPSISNQANKDMDKKVPATPRESSDIEPYRYPSDYLEYV